MEPLPQAAGAPADSGPQLHGQETGSQADLECLGREGGSPLHEGRVSPAWDQILHFGPENWAPLSSVLSSVKWDLLRTFFVEQLHDLNGTTQLGQEWPPLCLPGVEPGKPPGPVLLPTAPARRDGTRSEVPRAGRSPAAAAQGNHTPPQSRAWRPGPRVTRGLL